MVIWPEDRESHVTGTASHWWNSLSLIAVECSFGALTIVTDLDTVTLTLLSLRGVRPRSSMLLISNNLFVTTFKPSALLQAVRRCRSRVSRSSGLPSNDPWRRVANSSTAARSAVESDDSCRRAGVDGWIRGGGNGGFPRGTGAHTRNGGHLPIRHSCRLRCSSCLQRVRHAASPVGSRVGSWAVCCFGSDSCTTTSSGGSSSVGTLLIDSQCTANYI